MTYVAGERQSCPQTIFLLCTPMAAAIALKNPMKIDMVIHAFICILLHTKFLMFLKQRDFNDFPTTINTPFVTAITVHTPSI
jgi:hypothetical protein